MLSGSQLEYFLDRIPRWPLEGEAEDLSSACSWINDLGDILAELRPGLKLLAVEMKTTGKMAIWVRRWRISRTAAERQWSQFALDFVKETERDREKRMTTWSEVITIKQGQFEPTIDYILRMTLTMRLMPNELVYSMGRFQISSVVDMEAAIHFCQGLRSNHPYNLRYQDVSVSLSAAFERVLACTRGEGQENVESEENQLIVRRIADAAEAAEATETITVGSHQVPRAQFVRFENDFSGYLENISANDLVSTFEAWSLSLGEPNAALRIARAVRRMDHNTASRAFGRTNLNQHIVYR